MIHKCVGELWTTGDFVGAVLSLSGTACHCARCGALATLLWPALEQVQQRISSPSRLGAWTEEHVDAHIKEEVFCEYPWLKDRLAPV